jgi:TRAP-type C4-dicarboxylate transport system substrate-binding protein
MDLVVNQNVWNKLSPKMQRFVDDEVQVYSNVHHAAIQKADMEAWSKFTKAGIEINRLPIEDLDKFTKIAVPIWFKWANKDKDAARLFKAQLDILESPSFGYVTPDMYKGMKIDL